MRLVLDKDGNRSYVEDNYNLGKSISYNSNEKEQKDLELTKLKKEIANNSEIRKYHTRNS